MADEADEGGFLAIGLVSSDSEAAPPKKKVPRDFQSQEDYEAQKSTWKPTVEKGDLYKTLDLPLSNPSKQQFQTIIHAIEQLYFYKRFREADKLAEKVLEGELGGDCRNSIASYQARCRVRLEERRGVS